MPIIQQTYRREALFPILFPLDQRKGQLGEGALGTVGTVLDLGSLSNVIDLEVGDALFFISDEGELSGNASAEVVLGNTEEFVVDGISGSNVTLDHAWVSEPNSEDRFFEYKVLRRIAQRDFTFPRTAQVHSSLAAGALLAVNGELVTPTITNPSGQVTLITWSGGTVTLTPLGSGRYRCAPRITVDAHIELVVPDTSEDVEIRLSNLSVLADAPQWVIGNDQSLFLPWVKGRLQIYERILGLCYQEGEKGVDVKVVTARAADQQARAGSQLELLVNLAVAPTEAPFQTEGATIYFEAKDLVTSELKDPILAENVSPGLVRVLIPAAQMQAGVLNCQMVIYAGGAPEDVIRTNTFTLNVLA